VDVSASITSLLARRGTALNLTVGIKFLAVSYGERHVEMATEIRLCYFRVDGKLSQNRQPQEYEMSH